MSNIEALTEEECIKLVAGQEIGRIAFTGRYGPAVLPVNYRLHDGAIWFRTSVHGPLDDDLRTGIANADYVVAFEVDDIDPAHRAGWSVLIQGAAHRVISAAERVAAEQAGVMPWPDGEHELFIRISPHRVTGRRVTRSDAP